MKLGRGATGISAAVMALVLFATEAKSIQDTSLVQATIQPDDARRVVPLTESETPVGPLARGTRYRFTRNSMAWSGAFTLADLLTAIPGVYVARGGFFGQPEFVMYGGRGAAAIELYWDGMPLHPVGGDSVYQDLGRYSLSYLRQVDVTVSPGRMRVYLVSERHERLDPRTAIRVTSGSFNTAQYAGIFQRRWDNGFALNLAGDFAGSDGAPAARRNDQYLDLWAKVEWLPDDGSRGVVFQMRRQRQDRDPPPAAGGAPERDGDRTDQLFKIFSGARPDRLGWGAEVGLGSTTWGNDTIIGDRSIGQVFGAVGYAQPAVRFKAIGRVADARVRSELEGRLGWIPIDGIVVSGQARWQRYQGNRTAKSGTASLGVYRGPLSATAQAAVGEVVQGPALSLDSAQSVADASIRVGLDLTWLSGSAALVRRDAFLPLSVPDFTSVASHDSSVAATYLEANVYLRPVYPLSITGWYSHPRSKPADLQPPKHGRADITFRSKFWRTFRSGAFEFMVRYGIEYWSRGTAGVTAGATPIELPGATFHEWFVQFQLVGFKAFWNLRNARNTTAQYVPTLVYPRNAQIFGVKWEFSN